MVIKTLLTYVKYLSIIKNVSNLVHTTRFYKDILHVRLKSTDRKAK
jgi:hypothetical protein